MKMQYKQKNPVWKNLLSLPIIRAPFPFVLVLDVVMEMYHQICFPLYGIQKVSRAKYIQVMDRAKLKYLNIPEKIGCMYCGYVNGVFAYRERIANLTEQYRCGIMHAARSGFSPHQHHTDLEFTGFDDNKEFMKKYRS